MSSTICSDDFEQRLLDHVEMLYAVALKLARDPSDAERITRMTLAEAWRRRETWDRACSVKSELMTLLRQTFINHSQIPDCGGEPPEVVVQPRLRAARSYAGASYEGCRAMHRGALAVAL